MVVLIGKVYFFVSNAMKKVTNISHNSLKYFLLLTTLITILLVSYLLATPLQRMRSAVNNRTVSLVEGEAENDSENLRTAAGDCLLVEKFLPYFL